MQTAILEKGVWPHWLGPGSLQRQPGLGAGF